MSLWIITGSDFADALKWAFEKHDKANLDYLMAEFNIADHGVTKRQAMKSINEPWSEESVRKTTNGNGNRPVLKLYRRKSNARLYSEK